MTETTDKQCGACNCMAELLRLTHENTRLLKNHTEQLGAHQFAAKQAIKKIDEIHGYTQKMEAHVENLAVLPAIYDLLKGMKEDLIEPATGKKQMPVSIAMLVIVILGGLLIFDRVKGSNANLSLSPTTGLSIQQQQQLEQKKTESSK